MEFKVWPPRGVQEQEKEVFLEKLENSFNMWEAEQDLHGLSLQGREEERDQTKPDQNVEEHETVQSPHLTRPSPADQPERGQPGQVCEAEYWDLGLGSLSLGARGRRGEGVAGLGRRIRFKLNLGSRRRVVGPSWRRGANTTDSSMEGQSGLLGLLREKCADCGLEKGLKSHMSR